MTSKLLPVKGVPFRDQPLEFRFEQHVIQVAAFAEADLSALSPEEKVDWFLPLVVKDYDADMRPAVRVAVLAQFAAEASLTAGNPAKPVGFGNDKGVLWVKYEDGHVDRGLGRDEWSRIASQTMRSS